MAVTQPLGSERREYFRINDEVALQFRLVDKDEKSRRQEKRLAGHLDPSVVASCFANTSRQMKHSLERFRRDEPDIASYLDAMNTKVDLLVRLLLSSHSDLPDHPSHDVNISASGLAFRSKQSLEAGQLLELSIMFFPSLLYLNTFGRVLRCDAADVEQTQFPFATAIEFEFVDEAERELVIRHVLQKESEMLREARAEPVSNS